MRRSHLIWPLHPQHKKEPIGSFFDMLWSYGVDNFLSASRFGVAARCASQGYRTMANSLIRQGTNPLRTC